jgi:rRNA small subunit pseudouridine methyltransferase Nep1
MLFLKTRLTFLSIKDKDMLTLIFVESALETIPKSLLKNRFIKHYAEERGKSPEFVLLDRSYHHAAMKALKDSEKRGRPDIVHFALLEALGSPLNKEGLLQVYVHTFSDYVITIAPETRLPRNYNRFIGLMEQLFKFKKIPPTGHALLTIKKQNLPQLLQTVKPSYVLAFSRKGKKCTFEDAVSKLSSKKKPVAIIGGFPHGHFSENTSKLADETVAIDPEMLETWTVTSRLIYEYERVISLPGKRLMHRISWNTRIAN